MHDVAKISNGRALFFFSKKEAADRKSNNEVTRYAINYLPIKGAKLWWKKKKDRVRKTRWNVIVIFVLLYIWKTALAIFTLNINVIDRVYSITINVEELNLINTSTKSNDKLFNTKNCAILLNDFQRVHSKTQLLSPQCPYTITLYDSYIFIRNSVG